MKISRRIQALVESATLAVTQMAAQMRADDVDVVSFGAGEPQDFATPDHVIEAATRALAERQTRYPKTASGLAVLKNAIREKLKRENRLDYGLDQILVTVGGKDACYSIIQSLIDPGDEVLIPVPYWVSYPEIVKLAGGVPVFLSSKMADGFRIDAGQIAAAIGPRTRLLILNYPGNPAGHMYEPEQIRAIARALEGTDVAVLSDEIYDRLVFDGAEFLSFAAASKDALARCVTLNSASKTFSMPGWRLGFAAGPQPVIAAASKLQSQMTSGAATFSQIAYAAALDGDQACVDRMRAEYQRRGRVVFERLSAINDVRCNQPGGAFYVFPNVRGTYERLGVDTSVQFAQRLLDQAHVAVVPGAAFGMDDHVRLSYTAAPDRLELGLQRIAGFLDPS